MDLYSKSIFILWKINIACFSFQERLKCKLHTDRNIFSVEEGMEIKTCWCLGNVWKPVVVIAPHLRYFISYSTKYFPFHPLVLTISIMWVGQYFHSSADIKITEKQAFSQSWWTHKSCANPRIVDSIPASACHRMMCPGKGFNPKFLKDLHIGVWSVWMYKWVNVALV